MLYIHALRQISSPMGKLVLKSEFCNMRSLQELIYYTHVNAFSKYSISSTSSMK